MQKNNIVIFDDLNLNTPLRNAIIDLDFVQPTPIQEKAFPVIMSGIDMVGIAQTGTGKTIAYLLPVLRQLTYSELKHPRVLILAPTRELVIQVTNELNKLTKYMSVRIEAVYGGTNINTQKQRVYDGIDILVATPGRLFDLIMSGVLRLKSIQKVIIDEVDEMLNQGFRPQLMSILDTLPPKRQNLMFSATLTEPVKDIINHYFYCPNIIEIAAHGTPLDQIEQLGYNVLNYNTKINLIEHIIKTQNIEKVLIFVQNKKTADKLADILKTRITGDIGVIHSNKSQNFRINALNSFANGLTQVLIATDIVSRGIDINKVSHVINFDVPDQPADYIHRIGRTGRANQTGTAITLITKNDWQYAEAIENLTKQKINILPFPNQVEESQKFLPEERVALYDKDYIKYKPAKTAKSQTVVKLQKSKSAYKAYKAKISKNK